jgi:hypothetical protein
MERWTHGKTSSIWHQLKNVQLDKPYLYNRRARVMVDGQCGLKSLLKQGVPQGGVVPLY